MFKDAERQPMRGFTTVRDTASTVFGIRDAIDRDTVPGPRCFPNGAAISQTSGHGDCDPADELPPTLGGAPSRYRRSGTTAVANGLPEVLAATRQQFRRGATQVKIMAGGGVTSDYDPIGLLLLAGGRDAMTIPQDTEALLTRLAPLSVKGLRARFEKLENETHITVPYRAITPTLRLVTGAP